MTEKTSDWKIYLYVYLALMVLLGLTVGVTFIDLGVFSLIGTITIAVVKAVLVILYFMHVRHSNRVIQVYAIGGFVWLSILIGLTLSDYLTRIPPVF